MKILVLILLATATARADLVMYNFTGVSTLVGAGNETTVRLAGVLIWDVDTGRSWEVSHFTYYGGAARRLIVADLSESQLFTATGRSNRTFTAVLQSGTNFSNFTYGLNASLKIRPGRSVTLPRTARVTGHFLKPFAEFGFFHVFGPSSGTYSFAPVTTQAVNARGLTLDEAVAVWRTRYQNAGFVE